MVEPQHQERGWNRKEKADGKDSTEIESREPEGWGGKLKEEKCLSWLPSFLLRVKKT